MSGMIFGNGFSGDAKRSVVEYLEGYMRGRGVFYVTGVEGGWVTPGVMLRKWFRKFFLGLFFPFVLWSFLVVASYVGPGKEVCVSAVYGFRNTCNLVRRDSFYTFGTAVGHSFWLWIFFMFEGEGAYFILTNGAAFAVTIFGILVSFFLPLLGRDVVLACAVLVCWTHIGKGNLFYRWFFLLAVAVDFGAYAALGELIFQSGVVESYSSVENLEGAVELEFVPHPFLSLEVPVGSCVMTKGYFEDRAVGSGMTTGERVMALKGDRFLKLLAAHLVDVRNEEVAMVTEYEKAQEDRVFVLWLESMSVISGNGKKTRASFVEAVWGEVFDLYRTGLVSFDRVWEAYLVFHEETYAFR